MHKKPGDLNDAGSLQSDVEMSKKLSFMAAIKKASYSRVSFLSPFVFA